MALREVEVLYIFTALLASVFLLYRFRSSTKAPYLKVSPHVNERRNVSYVRYSTWTGRILPGLFYLWRGPKIILQNYGINGYPFAIWTPGAFYVHLQCEDHIKELKDAPSEQLSLHALSKDMFKPEYTMNGLEVQDTMSGNGNLHTRVFRVILSSHLPYLCSALSQIISKAFENEFVTGKKRGGSVHIPAFAMAKRIMTAASAVVFFGPTLSADPDFLKAALAYPEDLFFTAEILRLLPCFLHPLLAPILMRNHKASKTLVERLTPVVQQRLREARKHNISRNDHEAHPRDCIQFFIDVNCHKDQWTAEKIVQVLLGTWFAAIHQPALTLVYALRDLCDNPEYVEDLRREISNSCALNDAHEAEGSSIASWIDNAPLLDAFLKESSRLHPSDAISVRRKVLQPFTFSDGTHILPGDVACVPSQAIMRDEKFYCNSMDFSPSRFLQKVTHGEDEKGLQYRNTKRFTDADIAYPFWGLGRHSCPGRFYASAVLKLVMAHVLTHYNIQPILKSGSRTWSYRSSILPSTGFILSKRETELES